MAKDKQNRSEGEKQQERERKSRLDPKAVEDLDLPEDQARNVAAGRGYWYTGNGTFLEETDGPGGYGYGDG